MIPHSPLIENTAKKPNYSAAIPKRLPHWLIAVTVGCPTGTVKAIRTGQRNNNTQLGRKILFAESMIKESLTNIQKQVQL